MVYFSKSVIHSTMPIKRMNGKSNLIRMILKDSNNSSLCVRETDETMFSIQTQQHSKHSSRNLGIQAINLTRETKTSEEIFGNQYCVHINTIALCGCDKSKRSVYFVNSRLRQDTLYIFSSQNGKGARFLHPELPYTNIYYIFLREKNKQANKPK